MNKMRPILCWLFGALRIKERIWIFLSDCRDIRNLVLYFWNNKIPAPSKKQPIFKKQNFFEK